MCGIVKWNCDKNWGGKSGKIVDPKLKTSFFNDYSRHANVKCDQGIVFLLSAALVFNYYGLSYFLDRKLRQLNFLVGDCFYLRDI